MMAMTTNNSTNVKAPRLVRTIRSSTANKETGKKDESNQENRSRKMTWIYFGVCPAGNLAVLKSSDSMSMTPMAVKTNREPSYSLAS